jgi:hypothetical protein
MRDGISYLTKGSDGGDKDTPFNMIIDILSL